MATSVMAPSQEELQSFRYLRELLLNIIREIERGGLDPNTVDALHFRLDWLQGLIARLVHLYGIDEQIVYLIRGARDCLIGSQDIFGVSSPATAFTGQRGRPRYSIPRDQLDFLIDRCFSVVDIATLLGVSVRTVERRLFEFGLSVRLTYSSIDNEELDQLIQNILTEFPNTGYRRMTGFLRSRGLRVQQCRIREAMRRVNPAGVLLRALELRTIHRRRYQVYGPLALWHIDENHKLIRYHSIIY